MAIKRQLSRLKNGLLGETVRDYSDITEKEDCVRALLKSQNNEFRFELTCSNEEHGSICFKVPVKAQVLSALQELIEDIDQIRKGKTSKGLKLRFRHGEFDLVVTYRYEQNDSMQHQRTAPVNSRTYKMLKEMLADAEVALIGIEDSTNNTENW